MTPKEKAIELYNKFLNPSGDTYLYGMLEHESAKECALIAVNQLIEYHDFFMDYVRIDLPSNLIAGIPYKYWDKVKQEIEKL